MLKLQVEKIEDGLGVILPDNVLSHLQVKEGDDLILIPATDGYHLVASGSEFASQVLKAREVMDRYPNALRELAD